MSASLRGLLPWLVLLSGSCADEGPTRDLPPLPDLFALAEEARANHPDYSPELSMVVAELEERPEDAAALSRAGLLLLDVGRHPEVRATFAHALALAPDQGADVLGEVVHGWGRALLVLREVDSALIHLERARELLPNRATVHIDLGEAYALIGRDAEAITSYERSRELSTEYIEATYGLALLLEFEQPARALELHREVVALDPYHLGAHANLVALLEASGEGDAAVEARTRHVELALLKDLDVLDQAEAPVRYLAQAQHYAKNSRWEEARRVCAEGVEKHPEHSELYFLRGIIEAQAGDTTASRDSLLCSLELRPGTLRVLLQLADLYAGEAPPGRTPAARTLLEGAAAQWPEKSRFTQALSAWGDE